MFLSTILVVAGLGILGYWVSKKIEDSIKAEVATRAELYMANFISPHMQELAESHDLSPSSRERIAEDLARDAKGLSVREAKFWNLNGKILFGSDKTIIGKSFPLTDELKGAAAGRIEIDFDEEPHVDLEGGGTPNNSQVLEIYVPIRNSNTKEIIAVAEFYQDAKVLTNAVRLARMQSWGVTGLVSLGLIAGLYNVVARGSRLIEQQRKDLDDRIEELTVLLGQNETLRKGVETASQRANEDLESQLRRIGSDLHDGVGQILTIVMLRLDKVFPARSIKGKEYIVVKSMLDEAMAEIRDISVGLALPEIETLSLDEAITLVASRHARRTATKVDFALTKGSVEPSHPVKLCLCRFVQEGLNNSFKHAGGAGQKVSSDWTGTTIALKVSDRGPGITAKKINLNRQSLGLVGLKNRLESLGGQLTIVSEAGRGTTLTATLVVSS